MTLRTQIANDLTDVLLVTDDFAEAVTYSPADGGATRTVYAIVEEIGSLVDGDHGLSATETIQVTVSRDADATDSDGNTKNGIDNPQLGDAIRRPGDSADKCYSWTGEKSDVDDAAWQLTFVRHVMLKHGGSFQSR